MSIYVKDADGNRKKVAGVGLPGPAGKSAYQYAVEGGFSGTEDEFRALMGVRSNPNLLSNSRWTSRASIVNQRGQTEYPASSTPIYTIDRLVAVRTAVEIADSGLSLTPDLTAEIDGWIDFRLEEDEICNKEFTLSALIDGTLHVLLDTFPSEVGKSKYSAIVNGVQLYVARPKPYPVAGIIFTEQRPYLAKAAKLELGPVQTLAHKEGDAWVLNDPPPDKALELLKCQRFYTDAGTVRGLAGYISEGGEYGTFFVPTPATMRANPAVTCTRATIRVAGANYSAENVSLSKLSSCGIAIRATSPGMTAYASQPCGFFAENLAFSADL